MLSIIMEPLWVSMWGMKITQFWDLFYHIESVPNIKCQGIWFQVSGFRFQVSGVRIWRIQIADT